MNEIIKQTIEQNLGIKSWEGWDQFDVLDISFSDVVLEKDNKFGLPDDVVYGWVNVDFQNLIVEVGVFEPGNDDDPGTVVFSGKIELSVIK
ncbi:hypothetical protein BI036_gp055 [Morganella phage vB_MmoM_MP1]|uniref:Uncharacterized protein n=1 Tax=Morganella phage vB_MmoM_MP1 TaxID=1852628 RepID=A0A192YAS7_9CAUD|nr:hypothetical protein BI036_gp055 [Morganella phage vB_MmoM_MP1]ANM46588.1 hypothetical protein MP1_gp0055 [Morganella phage vB_MmoM_MP1]